MRPPPAAYPAGLLAPREPPCLSLYQPTHRTHPERAQDPIRYANLVDELADGLQRRYPASDAGALLAPFIALGRDPDFWSHSLDGLAVLGAAGVFRWYRLQRPVPAYTGVANGFHIRPLIRILQSADRYQVLGVARNEIRLFEGNRDAIAEVELHPEVPRDVVDALGSEISPAPGDYGQGSPQDEDQKDDRRFFRAVDRAIIEHHSQPSGLPLLLATLPQHETLFRAVSHNPQLLDTGLGVHPRDLSLAQLRDRAWRVLEPGYLARLAELVDEFGLARSAGLGTDDPLEAETASTAGRIATLLVEAERETPGELDEQVLRMGGEVVVVPAARMPTSSGVAATFRF